MILKQDNDREEIEKISVIMIDGSFRERFNLIDSFNRQTLSKDRYELLWIEFYSGVAPALRQKENLKIITLNHDGSEVYFAGVCLNEGIRQSSGNLLVFIDADTIVPPDFLENVWYEHENTDNMFLCYHRLVEAKKDSGDCSLEHLKRVCYLDHPNNVGGCSTIRKKHLFAINGFETDESYGGGYHMCDQNLLVRLKNHGISIRWHQEMRVYHPWHKGFGKCDRNRIAVKIFKDHEMTLKVLPYKGLLPEKNLPESEYPDFLKAALPKENFISNIVFKLSLYQRYRGLKAFLTGNPD